MMPGRSKESIQRQLKILYRNLDEFEERRAKFGINAPIDLINQINDVRQEISNLKTLLQEIEDAEERPFEIERQDEPIQTLGEWDWQNLLRRVEDGNVTPFIGPDVNHGLIPSDSEIAQTWADTHDYPLTDSNNLPRVAQFLAITRDPAFPAEAISRRLQDLNQTPNFEDDAEPHNFLASLPLPIYITTNYDDFMVQALNRRLRPAAREVCRWNDYLQDISSVFDPGSDFEASPVRPVVYHLFGHTESPESMVLTEDNYMDFLVNISKQPEVVPRRIQKALVKTSLIFLGYKLSSLRFRVLFRGLVASLERSLRRTRIAVQLTPESAEGMTEEAVRWYLEDYMAKDDIRIYWGSSFDFIEELKGRWEKFNERG